ncbi:Ligand-gated ion channel [Popillia japonica]|uniref:Ligand-gated ion channel n=1 Tax=Popillia japonica TaxID=7064 RepID=A0AAW1IT23_POPJA
MFYESKTFSIYVSLPCHRVLTSDKDNLTLVFNELEYNRNRQEGAEDDTSQSAESKQQSGSHDYEDDDRFLPFQRFKYRTHCCYGLSMDLLENVAQELEFGFQLYIVADGLFGTKVYTKEDVKRDVEKSYLSYKFKQDGGVRYNQYEKGVEKWNGIIGDLVSGAAHMSFAPLSVSSVRSEVIDYSVPYFFSGVSLLAAPRQKSEIPLMAFLLPFSPELWIAIFTSLNITAIAVAIYEWLSPFGLNPWGRQRSKNFSMSSALWVMWGLLCGHLVAFKAPKSWPNKFLINVWGGFSVIFVASYTANIAALIAGLFFHNTASNYHDGKLLSQRVGAPKASAAEYYVQRANSLLWQHMHKYSLENVEDGLERLRNGTLDIIIADTPILDYYRATDHGCKLQKIGDAINQDTYAIGMVKGFPLKDSISAVIAKYSSNGYMDILQEKWYGALPCFKLATDIAQPRPLGVAAVTGVFILLGVGIVLGCLILLVEHLFFKYTLPLLRDKPKGSIWRSRNIMFFSQKLYRFINCVELVSPHHAARELVHTIRQGQITSLFQKSIKREHEQRRRRKSKAQFFDMIQEIRSTIRRQQQQEREFPLESLKEVDSESIVSEDKKIKHSPSIIRRTFMRTSPKLESSIKAKSPTMYFNKQLFSPRAKNKAKSSTNLNVRRFSTDSVVNSQTLKLDHSNAVGRRLSKDVNSFLSTSPPDINSRRSSYLDIISSGSKLAGKSPVLSIENVSECSSSKSNEPLRKLSDSESIGRKLATLPKYKEPVDKHKLQPQYSLTIGRSEDAIARKNELAQTSAKSCQNISEAENIEIARLNPEHQKNNLSDDEIARRNKQTIEQLQTQLLASRPKEKPKPKDNNTKPKNVVNPQIRIQIEDTSKPSAPTKKLKTRHQSLGDKSAPPSESTSKKTKLTEHSRSLDSNPPRLRDRPKSPRSCREHDLPPAPPPPNCSPRNSNGRSPLERLSKDELVLLWRSSESELRSHLLKAIRDKEVDDPP